MLETLALMAALLLTGSGETNDARGVIIDMGEPASATSTPPPPTEEEARNVIIDIG